MGRIVPQGAEGQPVVHALVENISFSPLKTCVKEDGSESPVAGFEKAV
jgi:hypothetical protein